MLVFILISLYLTPIRASYATETFSQIKQRELRRTGIKKLAYASSFLTPSPVLV